MTKELLCTLGPASLSAPVIRRLEALNVSLFRLNLSHTKLEELEKTIAFIQGVSNVPLCLDSEGAQVRTGKLTTNTLKLDAGQFVFCSFEDRTLEAPGLTFYPDGIIREFQVGDLISIDFNSALVQVVDVSNTGVRLRVINSGITGNNKAVTVERDIPLPVLTDKDRAAMTLGHKMGIRHFALSFANSGDDIKLVRDIVGDSFLISKIECLNGLKNLDDIAAGSDALLIDRGDLSRQVSIERIPECQKLILQRGQALKTKVYVATNLLESMVTAPSPTRAEVNDIYNTLIDGADGLVLAAETAIGSYPIQCARMIGSIIERYDSRTLDTSKELESLAIRQSNLIDPHGGHLVYNIAVDDDLSDIDNLKSLIISDADLMDCEQLACGTYSPLDGFMTQAELEAVLNENRLQSGVIWTLPIVLVARSSDLEGISAGMRVRLLDNDGTLHSLIDVSEIYAPDIDRIAASWFGTSSDDHPGVRHLRQNGDTFVAGKVTLVNRRASPFRAYEITPADSRRIFDHKGWSRVVGFHGRNPAHRAHEFIQNAAVERAEADGLYITPVIGPKKPNDFLTDPILKSYELLINKGYYPSNGVLLGAFATYSRYSGPREAVFTALCRKNMGCSHFIIGRDHTGVGSFYEPDANLKMFETLGDIGIEALFFDNVGFDAERGELVEGQGDTISISGTEVREKFRGGEHLPEWFMRKEIQDFILSEIATGKDVFYS